MMMAAQANSRVIRGPCYVTRDVSHQLPSHMHLLHLLQHAGCLPTNLNTCRFAEHRHRPNHSSRVPHARAQQGDDRCGDSNVPQWHPCNCAASRWLMMLAPGAACHMCHVSCILETMMC